MRHRLSDGHIDAPLLIYVGRIGAEKKLHRLKKGMKIWSSLIILCSFFKLQINSSMENGIMVSDQKFFTLCCCFFLLLYFI